MSRDPYRDFVPYIRPYMRASHAIRAYAIGRRDVARARAMSRLLRLIRPLWEAGISRRDPVQVRHGLFSLKTLKTMIRVYQRASRLRAGSVAQREAVRFADMRLGET